jgi:hypothetical protein
MDDRPHVHDLVGATSIEAMPGRLCEVGREQLGVGGVGIALIASQEARSLLAASGDFVGELEEVQFDLGEGPCLDAVRQGQPALEPDVAGTGRERWPRFSAAALELGVAAVFSFPLQTGATRFGALDAARGTTGSLDSEQLERALHLAELASESVLLLQATGVRTSGDPVGPMSSQRFVVHQATGMVSAQADISLDDAMAWLRARAYRIQVPLDDIAADVVARRVTFETL